MPSPPLPLLVYLPGIDGTGITAYRQFLELSQRFDLRAVFIPADDRNGFGRLVHKIKVCTHTEGLVWRSTFILAREPGCIDDDD